MKPQTIKFYIKWIYKYLFYQYKYRIMHTLLPYPIKDHWTPYKPKVKLKVKMSTHLHVSVGACENLSELPSANGGSMGQVSLAETPLWRRGGNGRGTTVSTQLVPPPSNQPSILEGSTVYYMSLLSQNTLYCLYSVPHTPMHCIIYFEEHHDHNTAIPPSLKHIKTIHC